MEKIELKIPNIDDKIYKVFLIQDKFHTSVFIEVAEHCDVIKCFSFIIASKVFILNKKVFPVVKWCPDVDELLIHDKSWNPDTLRYIQSVQIAIDNYMLENIQQYISADFNV